MVNFESTIKTSISEALNKLYSISVAPSEVKLDETRKEFEGDATLVVFPFSKTAKKSPEQTANEIGEYLKANCSLVSGFNVVKGFLNISIADDFWVKFFEEASAVSGTYTNLKKTYLS